MQCIFCPAQLTKKNTPDPPFNTTNICKKCLVKISKQIESTAGYQVPGLKPQFGSKKKGGTH